MARVWSASMERRCQRCSRPDVYLDDQLLHFELRLDSTWSREIDICRECAEIDMDRVLGIVGRSMARQSVPPGGQGFGDSGR